MPSRRSPTIGLLAGLAVTLSAVAVYSTYTIVQLRSLRRLQTETIDRNRTDSLLLLRIQNNLNSLALTMRDMLDQSEPYPLTAWQPQFQRIRADLDDALAREEKLFAAATADQRALSGHFGGAVLGCAGPHFRAGRERAGRGGAHPHPLVAPGAPGGA